MIERYKYEHEVNLNSRRLNLFQELQNFPQNSEEVLWERELTDKKGNFHLELLTIRGNNSMDVWTVWIKEYKNWD